MERTKPDSTPSPAPCLSTVMGPALAVFDHGRRHRIFRSRLADLPGVVKVRELARTDEGLALLMEGAGRQNGVVEAMGGSIQVRSKPGQGSTFTVTLPPAS